MKKMNLMIVAAIVAGGISTVVSAKKNPEYEYQTEIPASIITEDKLKTRIGKLTFVDGFPTEETTEKIYDEMDYQRATQAYLMSMAGASMEALMNSIRERGGPDNESVLIWADRADSQVMLLTPNATTVYMLNVIDVSDGPRVVEIPENVLGLLNDHWFKYISDVGNAGEERGSGGLYLVVPPDYDPDIHGVLPPRWPEGPYIIRRASTYKNIMLMRGFIEQEDIDDPGNALLPAGSRPPRPPC